MILSELSWILELNDFRRRKIWLWRKHAKKYLLKMDMSAMNVSICWTGTLKA